MTSRVRTDDSDEEDIAKTFFSDDEDEQTAAERRAEELASLIDNDGELSDESESESEVDEDEDEDEDEDDVTMTDVSDFFPVPVPSVGDFEGEDKPKRKMAPGITLDDSPEKLQGEDQPTAGKRRRRIRDEEDRLLEELRRLENKSGPLSKAEEREAIRLRKKISEERLEEEADRTRNQADRRKLRELEKRLEQSRNDAEKIRLADEIVELENRILIHGDIDDASKSLTSTTERLGTLLEAHDTLVEAEDKAEDPVIRKAYERKQEEMQAQIQELYERQKAQQKLLELNHRQAFKETGVAYWKQDISRMLFDDSHFVWVQRAYTRRREDFDRTEPSYVRIAANVLRVESDPDKRFHLLSDANDRRKVRNLFASDTTDFATIVMASMVGRGFDLQAVCRYINRELRSIDVRRPVVDNSSEEEQRRMLNAMERFINVVLKALVDIRHVRTVSSERVMTDRQLHWRYKDARNLAAGESAVRRIRTVLKNFFMNFPIDTVPGRQFMSSLLKAKRFGPSWIPVSIKIEITDFMTRLKEIAAEAGVDASASSIEDSVYFQTIVTLQRDIATNKRLASRETYLEALREMESLRKFRAMSATFEEDKATGGTKLSVRKRTARFADAWIQAEDPYEFMGRFAAFLGMLPMGYIEERLFDTASTINREWQADFVKHLTSVLRFDVNTTPRVLRDIFGDHQSVEQRIRRVTDDQSAVVRILRAKASELGGNSESRDNSTRLVDAAIKELGGTTTTAEAMGFLKRFNISLDNYTLRPAQATTVAITDEATASLKAIRTNRLYKDIETYLTNYPSSQRPSIQAALLKQAGLSADWVDNTFHTIKRYNDARRRDPDVVFTSEDSPHDLERLQSILALPQKNDDLRDQFRRRMSTIESDQPLSREEKFEIVLNFILDDFDAEDEQANQLTDRLTISWFDAEVYDETALLDEDTIKIVDHLFVEWSKRDYRSDAQFRNAKLREKVTAFSRLEKGNVEALVEIMKDFGYNIQNWLTSTTAILPDDVFKAVDRAVTTYRTPLIGVKAPTITVPSTTTTADVILPFEAALQQEEDEDDDRPLMPPQRVDVSSDVVSEPEPESDYEAPGNQLADPDLAEQYEEDADAAYLAAEEEEEKKREQEKEEEKRRKQRKKKEEAVKKEEARRKRKEEAATVIDLTEDTEAPLVVYDLTEDIVAADDDDDDDDDEVAERMRVADREERRRAEKERQKRLAALADQVDDVMGDLQGRNDLMLKLQARVENLLVNDDRIINITDLRDELGLPMFDFRAFMESDIDRLSMASLRALEDAINKYEDGIHEDDDILSSILELQTSGNAHVIQHYTPDYDPHALVL